MSARTAATAPAGDLVVRRDDGDRLASLARRLQEHALPQDDPVVRTDFRPRHAGRGDRPKRVRREDRGDLTMADVDRHLSGDGAAAGRRRSH